MSEKLIMLLCALYIACYTSPVFSSAKAAVSCDVSASDENANDQLDFNDFDQKGVLPSTWRALDNRQCYESAIDVMQDYLVNGPVGTPNQRQDLMFHLGQSLGMAGRNREAALVIAGIRRDGLEPDGFDWQTYVIGTWAYFARDRRRLAAMRDKLQTEPGRGNKLNTKALSGLINCFNKPYRDAYSRACG